jgi:hypothetical protein
MDPEDKRKLEKVLSLSQENNAMLHKIRSVQKTAQMFRAIYWIFILGSALGAYYFVKPYLDGILSLYTGGTSSFKNASASVKIPDSKQFQDLINQFK